MNRRRLPVLLCLFLAATACLVAVSDITPTRADTTPHSWLDRTIEGEKRADLTAESFNEHANQRPGCVTQKTEEWVASAWWVWIPPKVWISNEQCVWPGATGYYGEDNTSRFILPYGTTRMQRLTHDHGGLVLAGEYVMPILNTDSFAIITSPFGQWHSPGPRQLRIVSNWNDTYTVQPGLTGLGNPQRVMSKDYDYTLNDNGEPVYGAHSNGLAVSANGEWIHALVENKAYILLNAKTHEVVPYAGIPFYPIYTTRVSISNDGRFVARTTDLDSLKVYDTSRCQAAQGNFVPRNCEFVELLGGDSSLIKDLFPGKEINVGRLQFIGNGDALDVDLRVGSGPSAANYTYRFKPSGSEPLKYLAMGDSFSSGEGAFDYVEATDMFVSDEEYNVCHLSRKSYPYLLQQNLQADWFHSVACSGSQSKDVSFGGPVEKYVIDGDPKSKFKILGSSQNERLEYAAQEAPLYENSMRSGYVPQNIFVTKHTPNIATISIGGNDVGFEGIVRSCIIKGATIDQVCFSNRVERESKANEIDQKISMWSKNFVDIKNSLGGGDPKLYVIGYPKLVDTNLNHRCGKNVPFDDAERLLTDKMIEYLNTAVKVAADAAGVRYVDVSDAFMRSGEERLCGPGPTFAANGLDMRSVISSCTSATAPNPPACPNSFHPNARGHELMSKAVIAKTANLTQPMPLNFNSTADLVNKRMEFVGDVDITLQNHRITYWKDIAPALIAKGEKIQINLSKSPTELPAKAGTTAIGTMHSTPRDLGQLPISADGTISGELTLPNDIETGYHRLIISYTDIADNIVERYAYFYAAQSSGDWDGDGIGNATDPCPSVQQSGVDQDADGIDDACDGEYVKSAQTPVLNNETAANSNTENRPSNKPTTEFALKTPTSDPFDSSAAVFDNLFSNQHDYDKQTTGIELNSSANMDETQTGQNDSDEAPRMFTSVFDLSGILAVLIASAIAWMVVRRNIG